ncbi:MAG TPA: DUF2971 domain-containing protein [Burkholderiaceae bacterium]
MIDPRELGNDEELLYHYTSADALLGMLGSPSRRAEIWMTQIQYMNDKVEWWEAYDMLNQHRRRMASNPSEELRRLAEHMGNGELSAFGRTFVFSLSSERDLLSQWRGYAPTGGYCIGFKKKHLRQIARKERFHFVRCMYEEQEKEASIAHLLDALRQDIANKYVDPRFAEIKDADPVLVTAWVKYQHGFNARATYFKHASFREERETRLVGDVPAGGGDGRARWRTRGNMVIPYCAIDIEPKDDFQPISEVIVGPGADYRLAHHAVQFLMMDRHREVEIRPSSSTLRF